MCSASNCCHCDSVGLICMNVVVISPPCCSHDLGSEKLLQIFFGEGWFSSNIGSLALLRTVLTNVIVFYGDFWLQYIHVHYTNFSITIQQCIHFACSRSIIIMCYAC